MFTIETRARSSGRDPWGPWLPLVDDDGAIELSVDEAREFLQNGDDDTWSEWRARSSKVILTREYPPEPPFNLAQATLASNAFFEKYL